MIATDVPKPVPGSEMVCSKVKVAAGLGRVYTATMLFPPSTSVFPFTAVDRTVATAGTRNEMVDRSVRDRVCIVLLPASLKMAKRRLVSNHRASMATELDRIRVISPVKKFVAEGRYRRRRDDVPDRGAMATYVAAELTVTGRISVNPVAVSVSKTLYSPAFDWYAMTRGADPPTLGATIKFPLSVPTTD